MARRIYGKCRCCNCGELFDEDDIKAVDEDRGEFWGMSCTERMYYSPCCTDDFEDAYEDDEEEDEDD